MEGVNSVMHAQRVAMANEVQMSVTKKVLDNMELQGAAINQLLQSAAQIGKAVGKGQNFDAIG